MTFRQMLVILIIAGCMWQAIFCAFDYVYASECVYENDLQYIRCCESRDRYHIVNDAGTHFGGYQFDLPTWYSVGGVGYPHEAAPEEQDYRAAILYSLRGRDPWKSCLA